MDTYDGYVFQIIGDAFCAAFHSASDALQAALEAQRSLYNEPWSPAPIKVRMGIHTGAAQINDSEQYAGYATLALTKRIMSAGHGGQILLSGATRELVRDIHPADSEFQDMGEKRLKDLLRPEHLYQLNGSGLPSNFPPLKTLDTFLNNLPTQLTTFIGRENQIAEVKQELESHRLVTLTGSGGTGKTRLSLQVAADLLEKFDHGVWFIELAPLTDPDLIPQTILSTIGISEQPNKMPLEILKEYLHEKKTLIVLDNCEHLVTASAHVTNTLLNAAPDLKVMTSSREALGVKGELSYPVPSLSLPDVKHLPTVEQLSQYESVRLFIDRALLVAPDFDVDEDNAPFIAQICYRLDGIPLAIELAAARVKMLSVEQISKRLDDRFRLLTGGARTSLPRQQTLRALIDWSYDILTENERLLLQRLSVFAGGWTLEAAEYVCVGQDDTSYSKSILPYDVLDLLTQLVNKSLVVVMEHSQSGETRYPAGGSLRYRMLETIRQYAREKLLEAGGSEIIHQQHLAYFVKLAEQAEHELYRSNQVFWFNKLDDELGNLRMALEWALASDAEVGLRITTTSWQFWGEYGYTQELENWLTQLLKVYDMQDALRAKALILQSRLIALQGDFSTSRTIAEQGLQLARTVKEKYLEAFGLLNLGQVIGASGDLGEYVPIIKNSLVLFRELGAQWGQAIAIGAFSLINNDLEYSKAFLIEALQLHRELGNLLGIAACLNQLALRNLWGGEFSAAAQMLNEALEIYRQTGSQAGEMDILQYHGNLAYWQGDYQQACAFFEESIILGEKLNMQIQTLWSRVNLAYAVLRQGDFQHAREKFEDSLKRMQKADSIIGMIYAIEGFASLNVNQEQPERAAQLFAWADGMREKIGDHRPPVEQASVERDLEVIHSRLSDSDFARLSTEGQRLTLDEAVALALEE
jgi:predicted ATPase